jgi:Mannosyl-glycoprotein endo-beta-N-acetylglucosaminidase
MRKLLRAALCAATFALNISASSPDLSPQPPNPNTANQEYIARFKDLAMFDQLSTGIPASIKLGQALLESQAGESELAMNANNHFGLKCRNCPESEAYMKTDDEYDKKTGALIYSKFQRFNTPEASYSAHSHRLTTESRYRPLFNNDRTNYRAWAYGLQKCGYATAKDYAERLIRIIEANNLQRFDKPSFLSIPEIAGTVPPQYPADNLSVNVPYDSDPNAANQAYLAEKPRKSGVEAIRTTQSNGRKIVNNFCTESAYISKEGEQMQFTLYEVTLEETPEEVNAKNAATKKQKAVLSQPVQRPKTVREPK